MLIFSIFLIGNIHFSYWRHTFFFHVYIQKQSETINLVFSSDQFWFWLSREKGSQIGICCCCILLFGKICDFVSTKLLLLHFPICYLAKFVILLSTKLLALHFHEQNLYSRIWVGVHEKGWEMDECVLCRILSRKLLPRQSHQWLIMSQGLQMGEFDH